MPRRFLALTIPVAFAATLTAASCALHTDPPIAPEPPLDAQGSGGGGGSDAGPVVQPRKPWIVDITTATHSSDFTAALACPAGYFVENVNDAWQMWDGSVYHYGFVLQCVTSALPFHPSATAATVYVTEIDGKPIDAMNAQIGSVCVPPAGMVYRWGHALNAYSSNAKKNFFACGFDNGDP